MIGDRVILKDVSPKDANEGGRICKNLRICGTGVYYYHRCELPLLGLGDSVPERVSGKTWIGVYRSPEVVTGNKDLFARIPIITGDHVFVNTENAKELTVGLTGDAVDVEHGEDGEDYLITTGTIVAGDGIRAYNEYGELSCGYDPRMEWCPETRMHGGKEYDAVLTGFNYVNHLLICKAARGGSKCAGLDAMPTPLQIFIKDFVPATPLQAIIQRGGRRMSAFDKLFGRKPAAGDSAVVSALLQSIALGADPARTVEKLKAVAGDAIKAEYYDALAVCGDEKPEDKQKAVDIIYGEYKKSAGDSDDGKCPKCGKSPCACEAGDEDKEPPKEGDKGEDKEPPKNDKEPPKEAGDAIDYDRLASLVAEKMGKMSGDSKPDAGAQALTLLASAIAGDTKSAGDTVDEFIKEVF